MIGRIQGKLIKKQAPRLMIDVHGVGYELEAPMSTFYDLPEIGVDIVLHTHLLVREDAQLLYGFLEEVDRALFRILIKINGVGARLALALMSGMTANEMTAAIQMEDVGAFVRIPGVGKKTAARLMVELRDRLEAWQPNEVGVTGSTSSADFVVDSVRDSVSALISLGYKPPEASRMVRNVDTVGLTSEQIIKQALRAVTN